MDVVTLGAALNGSKKYTDQVAQSLMGGVHYRGSVSYYADLPSDPAEGDSYTVKYAGTSGSVADGTEYTWGYDTDAQDYAWISFSKDAYSKAETDDTFVKKADEYNAGKTVPQGTQVTIDGTTYTVGQGAETFNDYVNNKAVGSFSHVEGVSSKSIGNYSHAEGQATTASGNSSHAEGETSVASGNKSHAEGGGCVSSGTCSHAEGSSSSATGDTCHAEGMGTTASGYYTHSEGAGTIASGYCSHAEGSGTKASSESQHVEGKYNVEDSNNKFAHIIGNGTSNNARSNAYAVDWDGKIYTHNSNTGFDIQSNYIEFPNGQRLYNSSTAPTGDIPDGSIGVGW